jgi:hypothetical protein
MAGVLELIGERFFKGPQIMGPRALRGRANLTFIELEVAEEILQEVFRMRAEDVEEMIPQRLIER